MRRWPVLRGWWQSAVHVVHWLRVHTVPLGSADATLQAVVLLACAARASFVLGTAWMAWFDSEDDSLPNDAERDPTDASPRCDVGAAWG